MQNNLPSSDEDSTNVETSWLEKWEPLIVFMSVASLPGYAFAVFGLKLPFGYSLLAFILLWIAIVVLLYFIDVAFIDGHQPPRLRRYRKFLWPNKE